MTSVARVSAAREINGTTRLGHKVPPYAKHCSSRLCLHAINNYRDESISRDFLRRLQRETYARVAIVVRLATSSTTSFLIHRLYCVAVPLQAEEQRLLRKAADTIELTIGQHKNRKSAAPTRV